MVEEGGGRRVDLFSFWRDGMGWDGRDGSISGLALTALLLSFFLVLVSRVCVAAVVVLRIADTVRCYVR